jgi:hypothetical protein
MYSQFHIAMHSDREWGEKPRRAAAVIDGKRLKSDRCGMLKAQVFFVI